MVKVCASSGEDVLKTPVLCCRVVLMGEVEVDGVESEGESGGRKLVHSVKGESWVVTSGSGGSEAESSGVEIGSSERHDAGTIPPILAWPNARVHGIGSSVVKTGSSNRHDAGTTPGSSGLSGPNDRVHAAVSVFVLSCCLCDWMVPLVMAMSNLTISTVVWLVVASWGDRFVSNSWSASSDPPRVVVGTPWVSVAAREQVKWSTTARIMQAANCLILRRFMLITGFGEGRSCLVFRVAARV